MQLEGWRSVPSPGRDRSDSMLRPLRPSDNVYVERNIPLNVDSASEMWGGKMGYESFIITFWWSTCVVLQLEFSDPEVGVHIMLNHKAHSHRDATKWESE